MSSRTESDALPKDLPVPAGGTDDPADSSIQALVPPHIRPRRQWRPRSFGDLVQGVGLFLTFGGLVLTAFTVHSLTRQLRANNQTNQVTIRGQLYQTENALLAAEGADDYQIFASIWASVPPDVSGAPYGQRLLGLITDDPVVLSTPNVEALYHRAYDAVTFADAQACNRTKTSADAQACDRTNKLRRLFLFVQSNVYHMHNAFDYYRGGVMNSEEWETWKGLVGEMNAHPVLLMVIWHGYQHRYFSRAFGDFLKEEICGRSAFGTDYRDRNCAFARYYYPEMFAPTWSAALPAY